MNYIGATRCLVLRRQRLTCSGIYPRYFSTKCDPLRILFCGSDDFSIASLNALQAEYLRFPETIASIDVVCRPPKRVGRGRKAVKEVPIKQAATRLALPIHEIDSFTGWTPPTQQGSPINLIVAVSFGLFIPSRILGSAKYGGLNVHPSMLPDFRGPAPLHHTLIAGDKKTGVTLQTLDTKRFDHGLILDQTPPPGFDIPDLENCDVPQLLSLVSTKGAQMLVNGIRNRVFVPPLKPVSGFSPQKKPTLRHAAKIKTEDQHIDWSTRSWDEIRRRQRVIGPLWNIAQTGTLVNGETSLQGKRIIITKMEHSDPTTTHISFTSVGPGLPFADTDSKTNGGHEPLYVFTSDGVLVRIEEIKVEGERPAPGLRAALKAKLIRPHSTDSTCTFYGPLQ